MPWRESDEIKGRGNLEPGKCAVTKQPLKGTQRQNTSEIGRVELMFPELTLTGGYQPVVSRLGASGLGVAKSYQHSTLI